MEQRTFRLFLLKNILYTLLVLACYLLQETPELLTLWGIRPTPVIGAVVAIAMTEGEFSGGLFGLFGGILCDMAAFHLSGVASIFFLVLGCTCGLLIVCLVQSNLRTALLLSAAFSLIYGLVSHYLIYGLWGYEHAGRLIFTRVLPGAALTALWGGGLFLLVRGLRARFDAALEQH
ncbi:MAG: hypothetical protein RRY21_03225 [Oscillospiraceae bacterium]